jgi:predicted DNA-binding transcriptional regulator AlpA
MKKPISQSKPGSKPVAGASAAPPASRSVGRQTSAAAAAAANLPPASKLLTAKELGSRFGKTQSAVYRWISEGLIPERFVHYSGMREILISVEVEELLRNSFREMHD